MCHMSCVTCHMSHITKYIYIFFIGKSVEAIWWRVCYQRGRPRLVFEMLRRAHTPNINAVAVLFERDQHLMFNHWWY